MDSHRTIAFVIGSYVKQGAVVRIGAPVPAQTVTNDNTVLKQIIIFGRHSVRSPLAPPSAYAIYSPRPYPNFGVPAGYLTVHGQQAAVLLGAYYRDYLLAEGLLTGDGATDLGHSYFRANSIQRSNLTATMFGQGLLPGVTIPVHSYPLNQPDPVFDPISAGVAAVVDRCRFVLAHRERGFRRLPVQVQA